MNRYLDNASAVTLAATLVLFLLAVLLKGITHDLLLEGGVFLISVKLLIASQKSHLAEQVYLQKLDHIQATLANMECREPHA